MADPGFFDAMLLGTALLSMVFISVYVGFFLVPALWILLLCGWPGIIAVLLTYEVLKGRSRSEVVGTPLIPPAPEPVPPFRACPVCGTLSDGRAAACWSCGNVLLPRYRGTTPPSKFCPVCGARLEGVSRYRRGYCGRCREYR